MKGSDKGILRRQTSDEFINTLFCMNWTEEQKRRTFNSYNVERAEYKLKAKEIEDQIRQL